MSCCIPLSVHVVVYLCTPLTLHSRAYYISCCNLQARDVEASLQEQLLEQFDELVLACAAKAGSTARSQHAIAAAAEAAARLQPILAVLPAAGAAGMSCLARACAAVHAKKRLKGRAVATGLQSIIQTSGQGVSGGSTEAHSACYMHACMQLTVGNCRRLTSTAGTRLQMHCCMGWVDCLYCGAVAYKQPEHTLSYRIVTMLWQVHKAMMHKGCLCWSIASHQ